MARHGQPVLYRADPARSRSQLPPLPGIFLTTVAVAVSMHASHSYSRVPRDSNCTSRHSHSRRETRPHVHTWRPTSPVCTATSHTRSSHIQHTVAHSPAVPHSYTHYSHPRGHSPAVFHTHVGVRTHVPLLARTWFLPTAVPLSHTACREARTPARPSPHHSHTGALSYSGSHTGSLSRTRVHSQPGALAHTVFPLHTGIHSHTGSLSHHSPHTPGHSH